ncbi:Proteophosphoglycan ppg4 [Rhodotorula diobovata]|uniref:Proteophosphoglycan ppg4 n=1 Tax=Rhodotorula diobovata TaxID=5288 RepID=A0A5C5G5V6_9BASI|nr:Proteophosphoglycan ppg4 [Rhodotorula diobovata]
MPAPRATAQSRARKSTVPDPDLYGDDGDPSSDDQPALKRSKPPPPAAAAASTKRTLTRRGSKGPQPVRGTVIADNGRRRSSRLSAEHAPAAQDEPDAPAPSSRAPAASTSHQPARKPKPANKSKKRALQETRPASDPEDDAADEGDEGQRAPAPASSRSSKRPRVEAAAADDDDDDRPSSSRQGRPNAPIASGSGSAPSAPAPRRGFVPRAVADLAARVDKPPPTFGTVLVDPDDEGGDGAGDPFPFTTNPPTPHGKKGQAAKRAAAAGGAGAKGKGKGKVPRIARPASPHSASDDGNDDDVVAAHAHASSDDHTPDSAAQPAPSHTAASTSSRRARGTANATTPPHAATREGRAPLPVHETPVQVKNIAFRAGAGPGTPATAPRGGRAAVPGSVGASGRRGSVRGSGKRGSSIGGGFEAVPHPQVADDKLYRSTDASDPLAKRLRAILSWASQRTRGRVLAPALPDGGDEVERAAREVVDGWVDDVCRLRVDTSVPFSEPSASQDPASLPPHPQNEANAARLVELEAAYAAIAQEQARRHALEPTYQAFFDRRAAAHDAAAAPGALPQRAWDDSVKMARTLETTSASAPLSSLADARALGRRVLDGAFSRPAGSSSSAAAAGPDAPPPPAIQDALSGTAALAHAAHRLEGFVRAAGAYVRLRGRETHAALGALVGGAGAGAGAGAGGEGEGAGLAAATTGAGGAAAQGGVDARELLRAIASADTVQGGSGGGGGGGR